MIAVADVVARGKLNVSQNALEALKSSNKNQYLELGLDDVVSVKGTDMVPPNVIHYYLGGGPDSPSKNAIIDSNGKSVTVFLVYCEDPNATGFHFVRFSPSAVRPFDEHEFLAIEQEVAKEKQVAESAQTAARSPDTWDNQVRKLLYELTVRQTQESAWKQLLKMPEESIPALIRAMSDSRKLADPWVVVPTNGSSFEALAHYSPKTVLEAVSILLNNKVNGGLRPITSWDTEKEKHTILNAWRVWAYYNCADSTK